MPTKSNLYERAGNGKQKLRNDKGPRKNRAPRYAHAFRGNILVAIIDNLPPEITLENYHRGKKTEFQCEVFISGELLGCFRYAPKLVDVTLTFFKREVKRTILDPDCGNEAATLFFQWLEQELERKNTEARSK